jgi:type I restriction enzyme M protein
MYCHIADFEELQENEFNLNVPRYIDIYESEEEVDIQTSIDKLKELEMEKQKIQVQVNANLKELGFDI